MQTFEEFKLLVEKSQDSAGFSFQPEQLEQFYKEQCLQQIGADLNLALGFFLKNHGDMNPQQIYDWHVTIRNFFGITEAREGMIDTSDNIDQNVRNNEQFPLKGSDFDLDKKELSRTEKIFQAEESLKKAGLIL